LNHSIIKKIYLIFISFWIINFFFSNYQLIPNSDEAFYILPAISFSHTNEIGYTQLNHGYTFFERFPLYTILLGFFYKITSPLLTLNFYTYKILNIFIFFIILILSFSIIKKFIEYNKSNDSYKVVLFPIALALSPISQIYFSTRPEFLGILLTLLGINFYLLKKRNFKPLKYEIAFFLFGLSVLCHPVFLIFNFFIFIQFFLKKKINKIILCGICNSIPIVFLIVYYYINLPESLSQFSIQAVGLPYFKAWIGLIHYSFDIFYNERLLIGLVNTLYYLPSLALLFYIIFKIKNNFFLILKIQKKEIIFSIFLSSLTLLILERNHPYLISVSCFYLIFLLFLLPWKNDFLRNVENKLKDRKRTFITIVFAFFIISSWNLIHLIKFNIYKKEFLENSTFIKFKKRILIENDLIIITRPEIVPYFIKEFNGQYINKIKKDIYWFFPDNGRGKNEIERKKSENFIKEILNNYSNDKILWIAAKKSFKNNCLTINDALSYSKPIKIKFNNINKLYDSNKHLAFKSNIIEYSDKTNACIKGYGE